MAVITYFAGRNEKHGAEYARWFALLATLVTFLLSLILLGGFDGASSEYQFVEKTPWFVGYDINYHVGIDGISLWLILLTTFLMPICILCSWRSIDKRVG